MEMVPDTPVRAFGVLIWVLIVLLVLLFVFGRTLRRRALLNLREALLRSSCPGPARLNAFLNEQTPDKEVSAHVETCERCQKALELLLAGKESWSAVPLNPRGTPATQDLALRRVMEDLKPNEIARAHI